MNEILPATNILFIWASYDVQKAIKNNRMSEFKQNQIV